jgi:hypothetical protein
VPDLRCDVLLRQRTQQRQLLRCLPQFAGTRTEGADVLLDGSLPTLLGPKRRSNRALAKLERDDPVIVIRRTARAARVALQKKE